LNIPFAATEQYPKGLGKTTPAISLLLHNTPIFEKTRFSAASPEVMAILKEKQIENIILIGAEAHICMLQTTLDLLKHNIRVHIP
ncbi:isochorismatase family protein, partial [Klebsiella pneumoniae]|nr:isochorismatase family protein [Klebsiella pneumoniae]